MNDAAIDIRIDEGPEAFTTEVKQLLAIVLFLFLRKTIFGLCDLELALALESHEAHSQIGAAYNGNRYSTLRTGETPTYTPSRLEGTRQFGIFGGAFQERISAHIRTEKPENVPKAHVMG